MINKQLKFEDFEKEKLSKNQQKKVRGGDDTGAPDEPGKGGTNGGHG